MNRLNAWILDAGDATLGRLLAWSPDAALLCAAILAVLFMIFARRLFCNRLVRKRCLADRRRLRKLMAAARRDGDRGEIRRHRWTLARVARQRLKVEGPAWLASVIPVAMLMIWCSSRLELLPQPADGTVRLQLHVPAIDAGRVVHLVPVRGVRPQSWIKVLRGEPAENPARAVAEWDVVFNGSGPFTLQWRLGDRTVSRELVCEREGVRLPRQTVNGWTTGVEARPYQPFGLRPPQWWPAPAWLTWLLPVVLILHTATRNW